MPASALTLYAIWEDVPASGDNTLLYIGIAATVLISLAAAGYFVFIRKP